MTERNTASLLPLHESYSNSLLEVHWAAQIVAAASHVLEPAPDWSHTSLLVETETLRTRPLPGAHGHCVSVDLATLMLRHGDSSFALVGETVASGLQWLSGVLGRKVSRLEHDLPARPLEQPFSLFGGEAQVMAWFHMAQVVIDRVRAQSNGGEVRLWPHHFDIATLIALDEGANTDEGARSINVGLSPGDGNYAEPYLYVTPWPTLEGALPSLAEGHWHTDGFTAAVLPASEMQTVGLGEQAQRFVDGAVEVSREALG